MEQYSYNTRKLFRIWFNKNPDVFMNDENKLRTIRLRSNNPSATITLLYSKKLLSEKGLMDLNYFLKLNKIDGVDINDLSLSKSDEKLMRLVDMELTNWVKDEYGNPAAASDMIRMMESVIGKYGIYTDFEVEVNLENLQEKIALPTPFIHTDRNNDIILCGMDSSGNLSQDAKKIIHKYSDCVHSSYNAANLFGLSLAFDLNTATYAGLVLPKIDMSKKYSIFEIRKIVNNLSEKDLYEYVAPHFKAFNITAPDITGKSNEEIMSMMTPLRIEAINYLPDSIKNSEAMKEVANLSATDQIKFYQNEFNIFKHSAIIATVTSFSGPPIVEMLAGEHKHNLNLYTTLYNALYSKNSIAKITEEIKMMKKSTVQLVLSDVVNSLTGECCDASWTKVGAEKAASRDTVITNSIVCIQRNVRKYLAKQDLQNEGIGINL